MGENKKAVATTNEGPELLKLPRRDPAQAVRETSLMRGMPEALAIVVGGGAGVAVEEWVFTVTSSFLWSGAIGAAVGLSILWAVRYARVLWDQPMEKYALLAGAYERVLGERDTAEERVGSLEGRLADLEEARPRMEAKGLRPGERSISGFTVLSEPPQTICVRRVFVVNHGEDTFLQDWEVWYEAPGEQELIQADVLTESEWAKVSANIPGGDVTVVCAGDAVRIARKDPTRYDVPFVVRGLIYDDVANPGCLVEVRYKDGDGHEWKYSGRIKNRLG